MSLPSLKLGVAKWLTLPKETEEQWAEQWTEDTDFWVDTLGEATADEMDAPLAWPLRWPQGIEPMQDALWEQETHQWARGSAVWHAPHWPILISLPELRAIR